MAKKVVVGVDGSDQSVGALQYAARLAESFDARLLVVGAWSIPSLGAEAPPLDPELIDSGMREAVEGSVATAFGGAAPEGLEIKIVNASAAQALLDASEDAELLVVGSRGHGGFAGLLLGSVSMTVAEHAKCPVLVFH